jgi:cobalt-zinc-cadmium efflux system outer membrane protein
MKKLILLACWFAASAAAQPLGSDLAGLLAHARQNNPDFAAMQREADAAAQRVQPAGALPDPQFRVEFMNIDKPREERETKYTLMQMLPAPGKRAAMRGMAEANAREAQARAQAMWVEQAMKIRTAYAQYWLAAHNERITQEITDLMTRLEQVAQTRYAGGLVPQQDAIRAQLEQTAMRSELIMAANEKRQQRARINGLLGREPAAPLAEPQVLPPLPAQLAATALLDKAREASPSVRAEAARLQSAQSNRELAYRNRWPDMSVGVGPTQMGSRIESWGVMFEMNIPLQQQTRRSQEREAVAMVDAARARLEAAENQLRAELEAQLAGLDAARRTEALVQSHQLPQSELVLKSAVASYENGKVDFATLLDAQRAIRKARLDLLKAQVEAQMRIAEIEKTVGEPL